MAQVNDPSQHSQADKSDFAAIGEAVSDGRWEITVKVKITKLRCDVYFQTGSGPTVGQFAGQLQAKPPSGYLLHVWLDVRNLQDRPATFEMVEFSVGEGGFSSKPSAYVDWRGVRAGVPIVQQSAEFSMIAGEKGEFSFLFAAETGHPDLFLRFKDLKPIKIGVGNPRAVEPWIAKLQDPNPATRKEAAGVLGELKDPRALEPLLTALRDESADVRIAVIQALHGVRSEKAVEPLVRCLADTDQWVRLNAARALGATRDVRAVPALVQVLKDDPAVVGAESRLRCSVVEALGWIGDPSVVEPLIQVLKKDKGRDSCRAAAEALGTIGDPSAVEPLIQVLKEDGAKENRRAAAEALGKIGDARAVDALIHALKTDQEFVTIGAGEGSGGHQRRSRRGTFD